MSSFDPIAPQQALLASWPGRPVDAGGLLRILNEEGHRPPLFWIFNGAAEARQLGCFLGPEQPLIFSRSTNLLVPPEADGAKARERLVDQIAQRLAAHVPAAHLDMGASCQGAPMVLMLSNRIQAEGLRAGAMCLINCPLPRIPTQRPALLVYGSEDAVHDPFRKDAQEAAAQARHAFSDYRRVLLAAGHGQYYSEALLAQIFPRFDQLRASAPMSASAVARSTTLGA